MVGPDFNFSREELDVLEPMGVNAMVYVPRKGTYINSNQTAKQNPVTGLSKINIRELCIFLQDEIESLLQNYQWEFNTQALRETIKSKADVIRETVKNNGGLYTYLNVCDESNNTDDIIDNEMLVLSTSIEPAKGAGKMVHELTIYRKGGMSSLIK
jgi:phage tail sheath protein FI